ncbi:copper resistance protein CopC/CopD [Microbispora sp. NEAU-D428]|uniref:copper resistance CopC/CopD family protein n=1 Tax=Microbispora sitophila TaxID=2771537 RepID=UPI001867DF60|nr:copper resistance protein CopC [Microbispora sitophila]MBE3014042.1 copper resistance protein CopC/CopD [Microbispora sitophila]
MLRRHGTRGTGAAAPIAGPIAGPRPARLVARLVAVVLLAAGGLVAGLFPGTAARPAYAHAYLLESSPVDGQVLASPPAEVRLRFDEAVSLGRRSIQLLDPTGKELAIDAAGYADGKIDTARATLPRDLAEGTYVVSWRVTSVDSHVVSGAFSFSVGHPSATAAPVERDTDRVVPVVASVGRAVAYLGAALALGGGLFVAALWPAGRDDRRGRRVVWSGLAALAAGTAVVLLVQGPYADGRPLTAVFDPSLLGATLSTRLGHALLARLVLVVVLGVVFLIAVGRPPLGAGPETTQTTDPETTDSETTDPETTGPASAGPESAGPDSAGPGSAGSESAGFEPADLEPAAAARRIALPAVAAAGAVALTLTWTLADHAQSGAQIWLAVPATSLHLLAMALWLGGLVALAVCVLAPAGKRGPALLSLEPALPRFSRLALLCFAVIAVTGLYLSWRQVGTWGALGGTDFGRLLLGKLAAVLGVLALASGARRFVQRRDRLPRGPGAAVRRLRRSVAGEVVLGVVVVSITAVLVDTAPARTSYAPPVDTTVPFPAAAANASGPYGGLRGGSIQLKIEPARPGSNTADIYLTGRDGTLIPVPEISGALESRDRAVPALPVKVTAAEPGHYVAGSMSIPYPGEWVLRLDIRVSDFDETRARVPFTAH